MRSSSCVEGEGGGGRGGGGRSGGGDILCPRYFCECMQANILGCHGNMGKKGVVRGEESGRVE